MLDFDLTEEQLSLREMARDFAEKEIRPIAEKLDRSENLQEDFPWDLVRLGSQLGLRTVGLPEEYGGLGFDIRTWLVIYDELAYADISCANIFGQNWKGARRIGLQGTQDQKDRFLTAFRDDDTYLLAGAATEPESGSDNHLPYDVPGAGVMLSAEREGDHYVLNGRKRFISHASVAKLLIVSARTDKTVGASKGSSRFLLPTDTPGFEVVRVHDKVGLRMSIQAELYFDDVRVPVENLLGGREGAAPYEVGENQVELAALGMGLGRAALDAAMEHAKTRVQGGQPIVKHQAVAMMLADMHLKLQAGRSLLWRAAWALDRGHHDPALFFSTKVFCVETALEICLAAAEVFGGSGVMRELPIQRYVRDAMVLQHMDGTNQINRIKIGRILAS